MLDILLKSIGIIGIGAIITGCSHTSLGQKIAVESINDPYALYNGISVPYDLNKAFVLAKKQCEENNLDSCFLYAYLLDKEEGVKQNKEEAYRIFEKSCNGYEKTINITENGTLISKKVLLQDSNSCYFVAKKLFDEKKYIEAYQKNQIYAKGGSKKLFIANDNTNTRAWEYKKMIFSEIPFDSLLSYEKPKNKITEDKPTIYGEDKSSVILFENIEKNKAYAPKVLAYYDFMIKKAEKEKNSKELFYFKKNKAIFLEALGKSQEAEKIYKENCELSDGFSCIYYKNIKVRGGNLK